jgi:hypothetical protein
MAESSNMSLFTTGNLPLRVQAVAVFQINGVEHALRARIVCRAISPLGGLREAICRRYGKILRI